MVFKRPGGEIRELVFACLRLPDAANKYFDSEQLAELCNVAAGLPAQTELSKRAIANAFSMLQVTAESLVLSFLTNSKDIQARLLLWGDLLQMHTRLLQRIG